MTKTDETSGSLPLDFRELLDSLLESFIAENGRQRCYPGLIFNQGGRTMFQINVPAKDLENLLQTKPATANNPDSGKDRPEIKGHADEIGQYIVDRASAKKPWVIGTLTASVAPEMITIIELSRGICIVLIPKGVKLDMLDGQHRMKAICQLLKSGGSRLISEESVPITVILEDDFYQCQVDFRDMAQAKPVEKSLWLWFGESSGVSGITKKLIEKVYMFNGKTDKINRSPSSQDKLIYTTNYIARTVGCAFAENPSATLENYDIEKCSQALAKCLNQFFSECRQTKYISEQKIEKITLEEVNSFKKECLLGVSVGVEILGRLFYYAQDGGSDYFDYNKISQLAKLDWSRDNSLWHNNIIRINTKLKNPSKTISWGAGAIADAVKAAKIELNWI